MVLVECGFEQFHHFFELFLILLLHAVCKLSDHEGLCFELFDFLNFFVGDAVRNAETNRFGGGFVLLVKLSKFLLDENAEVGECLICLWLGVPIAEGRFVFARSMECCKGEGKS